MMLIFNENKGQTIAQDLKITTFRKLTSLNMAHDLKITIILHLVIELHFSDSP